MTESKAEFLQNVAANVTRLAEAKGWSVRDLAREAGESPSTVYRMMTGSHEVGSYSSARVAAALGTTIDGLRKPVEKKSRQLASA